MISEDAIIDFANILFENSVYNADFSKLLVIDDTYEIHAKHEKIENDECVYSITLYDKSNETEIDNIYCDIDKEQIEDMIYFFIEEYIEGYVEE